LATTFLYTIADTAPESLAPVKLAAANFFFVGGQFTNKTLLILREQKHIPLIEQSLVNLQAENHRGPPRLINRA